MAYDILNEYGDYNKDQVVTDISVSAYWVMAVFPLSYPATYKRSDEKSFDSDVSKGVKTEKPLILFDSVASVNVNSNKSSHIGTMSAVLFPTAEFLSLINPGDYVFCWMMNSESIQHQVIEALKKKQACNGFNQGLKFYGRVNSIREQIHQQPDGPRVTRFIINGSSFTELEATFFYEQHLASTPEGVATQLDKMNLALDKILDKADGGIVPNKMIVALIDVFLGVGIKQNLASGNDEKELQSTFGTSGDYSHILPTDVGAIINKTLKSGSVLKSADTIEIVHGVQHFSGGLSSVAKDHGTTESSGTLSLDSKDNVKSISKYFAPDNTISSDSRRFTGTDLLGRNSPIPPSLINSSVWSVCQQYLNNSCNEMYATLRTNPDGDIVPTVVVRQMPFSTEASKAATTTPFKNLPRWKVPSIIVRSADVGRSDAMRFNFIHVYGTSDTVDARNITQQMVAAPPKTDAMDIARSGLRPFMMTVPCWTHETRGDAGSDDVTAVGNSGPDKWMDVISDFIMGQHMTLTGVLSTVGIQSPICVGDNLEWDNVLYHIESVTHSCSMAPDGHKTFTTTLSLTHGIGIDTFESSGVTDISLYARVSPAQNESTYLSQTNADGGLDKEAIDSSENKNDKDKERIRNNELQKQVTDIKGSLF